MTGSQISEKTIGLWEYTEQSQKIRNLERDVKTINQEKDEEMKTQDSLIKFLLKVIEDRNLSVALSPKPVNKNDEEIIVEQEDETRHLRQDEMEESCGSTKQKCKRPSLWKRFKKLFVCGSSDMEIEEEVKESRRSTKNKCKRPSLWKRFKNLFVCRSSDMEIE